MPMLLYLIKHDGRGGCRQLLSPTNLENLSRGRPRKTGLRVLTIFLS